MLTNATGFPVHKAFKFPGNIVDISAGLMYVLARHSKNSPAAVQSGEAFHFISMEGKVLKRLSVLMALIAGMVLFAAPQQIHAADGDVTVDIHGPGVDHNGVYTGSAFQVDVTAEGISDPDGLAGGQFELDYEESILSVHTTAPNGPQIGSDLSDNNCSLESNEIGGGVLRVAFVCTTPEDISTPTNVVLATIIFEQTNPPVTDTSVDFTVNVPFLNDGSTPTPQTIDTVLNGVTGTANIVAGTCGDQDGSDTINTIDATIDALFSVGIIPGLSDEQLVLSDVVRDGAVDVGDALLTLQHIVGIFTITDCGPADPLAPVP